jgi:hypothetical protein
MSEFNVLVGKRINGLFIGDSAWSLVFRDINGRHYCFRTENDCCNTVWFNHVNGVETVLGEGNVFDILRGAMVTAVESKGWTDDRTDEDGYDVIQDGFLDHRNRSWLHRLGSAQQPQRLLWWQCGVRCGV